MDNKVPTIAIDFLCLFLNKREKNTYAKKLEFAGFKNLFVSKKILQIEEKIIDALLAPEPSLIILIIHQSQQKDIRSSKFIHWPLFKNDYSKILVLLDKQIRIGCRNEQTFPPKKNSITFFRSNRLLELAHQAQKLQSNLSNPALIFVQINNEVIRKEIQERKAEIETQKNNKSLQSNMMSTSQCSVSQILTEKDQKQWKQQNSTVTILKKGTQDLSFILDKIQKEPISESIKQHSNEKQENFGEQNNKILEDANQEEEEKKQQKLDSVLNEISYIDPKEQDNSNFLENELADQQEIDNNKKPDQSKGFILPNFQKQILEEQSIKQQSSCAIQQQNQDNDKRNCESLGFEKQNLIILDEKDSMNMENENSKSETQSKINLKIKRKDKSEIQNLKRKRLLKSHRDKMEQSLGRKSKFDMFIASSEIKTYQKNKQAYRYPPKSTHFKIFLQSVSSERSYQRFDSLVVYWIDPRIENNYHIIQSFMAKCNKKVRICQFKQMTQQIYADISSNNSTEYVIICSNSTFQKVFKSSQYPYANCLSYFIYCGQQEIARSNIQSYGIITPVVVDTDPESFENHLFLYLENRFYCIYGHAFS